MSFQTSVNNALPPAVEGAFASANPRVNRLAGEGQFLADAVNGVIVGRFVWTGVNSDDNQVGNAGTGVPDGFIANELQAQITTWLAGDSLVVQPGSPITPYVKGEFWVKTATVATVGQKVFASNTDGSIKTDAAGATVTGYTETTYSVASAGAVDDLIKITNWE